VLLFLSYVFEKGRHDQLRSFLNPTTSEADIYRVQGQRYQDNRRIYHINLIINVSQVVIITELKPFVHVVVFIIQIKHPVQFCFLPQPLPSQRNVVYSQNHLDGLSSKLNGACTD
jgi:hypothetical protein